MLRSSDVEQLVRRHQLTCYHNIVSAMEQPKVRFILPAGPYTTVFYGQIRQFLLHFSAAGIRIFPADDMDRPPRLLPWRTLTRFRVRRRLLTYRLTVQTENGKWQFIINRFILGNPRQRENITCLAENGFFQPCELRR